MLKKERAHLKPSDQKTISSQLCKRMCPVLQERKDAPSNIHDWNQPVHGHMSKKPQEGELANDSANDIERL